jgi:chromosome segregation ATPase
MSEKSNLLPLKPPQSPKLGGLSTNSPPRIGGLGGAKITFQMSSQEIIQQNNIQTQLAKLLSDRPFDLDGILLKRDRLVDDLDELQQSIDNIKQDTKSFKRSEVEETWRKLGAEEKNVEATRERINRLSRELDKEKQEENRLLQEIETLGGQDKETATLVKQMKLAQGLRDAANELIEWYIGDRTKQRCNSANRSFTHDCCIRDRYQRTSGIY